MAPYRYVGIGARPRKLPNHIGAAVVKVLLGHPSIQGSHAIIIGGIWIGPGLDQRFDKRPCLRGMLREQVERGSTMLVRCVGIGTGLKQVGHVVQRHAVAHREMQWRGPIAVPSVNVCPTINEQSDALAEIPRHISSGLPRRVARTRREE